MDWHVVHVRINDAATGQTTPVRIRFTTPEGQYLPPLGREAIPVGHQGGSITLDGKTYAHVDGSFEIRLPVGPLEVEICKRPAYVPLQQTVVRKGGQIALRFALERSTTRCFDGYHAGDVAAFGLSPAAATLEGAAEGLRFVNVLARQAEDGSYPGLLDFSGQHPAHSRSDCQAFVNTLNDGGDAGQVYLLNGHRIIYPLRLGAEGFERYGFADWSQQCHRKGGLVVWPWRDRPQLSPAGEWQVVDALAWTTVTTDVWQHLEHWYALLNQGLRLPLVGGSAKATNRVTLGAIRTMTWLPEGQEVTYGNWIESMRLGRTIVTRGPMLTLRVGENRPWALFDGSPVVAEAWHAPPGAALELLANGVVVATAIVHSDQQRLEHVFAEPSSIRWLSLRCRAGDVLWAHTSPTYARKQSTEAQQPGA